MKVAVCVILVLCLGACTGQSRQNPLWKSYEVTCLTKDCNRFSLRLALQSENDSASTRFLDKCRAKIEACTLDSIEKHYKVVVADIWSEAKEDKDILAVEFFSR